MTGVRWSATRRITRRSGPTGSLACAVALAAMDAARSVLEKPMCHTIEQAHALVQTAKETSRIIQVGSQTTSGDQWAKAKEAIAKGMIGNMIMSQGSYHRNSIEGEWNYSNT